MMNRNVMQRQMFANGGAAFPDLSGDGNVTQKDILMGRGVLPMQEGGSPMMMPPPPGGAMMPPPGGPMGGPPPMPPGAAMAPPGAADQGAFDPAVLEGMLADSAQSMQSMDAAAEAGDYASVINSIRGDEMPIEARYEELAGMVGPEDSQQTPESVLTLLQPVMQMAAVDQGIGGLAQEEMTSPIEGPMAEGIMSTVNMEGPPAGPDQMAMAAPGGAAPVNFRQGGAVQYFNPENANRVVQPDPLGGRLGEINKEKLALYQNIMGSKDQQSAFEDQKKMTKAQMLFDIAQGALAFATPGETAMSPAERLAQVAQPVLGNIGARAGELQKFKQGQEQEQRALKLQALDSAERTLTSEISTKAARDLQDDAQAFSFRENRLNDAQEITIKNMEFDYGNQQRLSTQAHKEKLKDITYQNDVAILGLQNVNSVEGIKIRNKLEQDNLKLRAELTATQSLADLEGQMKRDGVLDGYSLRNIQGEQDFRFKLADHNAAIMKEQNSLNQAFTAGENALNRQDDKEARMSNQEFQKLMQADLQDFQGTQKDKDRVIAALNRAFDEKLATRGADQKDLQLSLSERQVVLDDFYKKGMLGVEQAALNAVSLGTKATTDQIQYFADQDRLNRYANNQMDQTEVNEFEGGLTNYNKTTSYDWDGRKYTVSAPGLTNALQAAIMARQTNHPDLAKISLPPGSLTYSPSSEQTSVKTGDGTETETGEEIKSLLKANVQLFNENGSVNTEAPEWELTPTVRYKPELDESFRKVIGISRAYPGFKATGSEIFQELFKGKSNPESVAFRDAQKALTAYSNDLLQYSTDVQGSRVLKFVQELLEKETTGTRPGGLILRTDADAGATLKSLEDTLKLAMQASANILPEYNGNVGDFTSDQITKERDFMDRTKLLLNETLGFKKAFVFNEPETKRTTVIDGVDQSTEQAKNQINLLRKK